MHTQGILAAVGFADCHPLSARAHSVTMSISVQPQAPVATRICRDGKNNKTSQTRARVTWSYTARVRQNGYLIRWSKRAQSHTQSLCDLHSTRRAHTHTKLSILAHSRTLTTERHYLGENNDTTTTTTTRETAAQCCAKFCKCVASRAIGAREHTYKTTEQNYVCGELRTRPHG